MRRLPWIGWLLALGLVPATPLSANEAAEQARAWREQHEGVIIERFADLLRLPNVASDRVNIRRNAEHIQNLLEQAGLSTRLLESDGANPAVFGERRVPGARRTVLIYVHYDGQPVNPDDWASDPWTPVLRTDLVENGGREVPMTPPFDPEWRLFARSASDDKAPVIALQSALLALDAAGIPLSVNLKVFMEGEEEAGSPNLRALLERHREALAADVWLFCDGPVHPSRRWQMVYGVRGSYGFNLTVYGPTRPLHSGHYGNWAPNPAMRLAELLVTMRDSTGRITIDGFHDQVRPLGDAEREAIAASPRMDETLLAEFGLAAAETDDRVELAITRPALNLRGIASGGVGAESRNAIQTSATASVGIRLVPDMQPAALEPLVEDHIRQQGYHVVHSEPSPEERARHARIARVQWSSSGGYPAYRADMSQPLARETSALLDQLSDGTLIQTPTMGGSLPIYIVDEVLDTPVLMLPIANHDNNQHGSDENLRLQNLWDAIEIYAAVLTGL